MCCWWVSMCVLCYCAHWLWLVSMQVAYWFYLDLIRPEDPTLPACSMKEFMATGTPLLPACLTYLPDTVSVRLYSTLLLQ